MTWVMPRLESKNSCWFWANSERARAGLPTAAPLPSWRLRLSWEPFREQVVASGTPVVKRDPQRVWTKRWRALRHSALDRVDKLMERGLGKNVDDRGPIEPACWLEWMDGSVCESGSKRFSARARYTNRPDASQRRTGSSDGDQLRRVHTHSVSHAHFF